MCARAQEAEESGGGRRGGTAAPNEGHAGWPLLARPLMHPRPPGLPGRLTEWRRSGSRDSQTLRVAVLSEADGQECGTETRSVREHLEEARNESRRADGRHGRHSAGLSECLRCTGGYEDQMDQ